MPISTQSTYNSATAPNEIPQEGSDTSRTLIIVGDDGKTYKLTKDIWMKGEFITEDPVAHGIVDNLDSFGVYLAYIPPDIAIGIGNICTFVNLRLVLKNNHVDTLSGSSYTEGPAGPTSPTPGAESMAAAPYESESGGPARSSHDTI